jgi:hypothetical protein
MWFFPMDMSFHHSSSRKTAPDAIVDLIERRQDGEARRLIQVSPPVVQAEAIRELLWRGDSAGFLLAKEMLDLVRLPHDDLRTVFATAAEVGQIPMLRGILKTSGDAVDSRTLRLAFEAALHEKRAEVITFLGETKLLSPETKYRAIRPSIYQAASGPDHTGTPRCEMGTVEVVITAAYRNEIADRRERRSKEITRGSETDAQKREWRVERKYNRLIAESAKRIQLSLPPIGIDSPLHEVEHRREVKELLIAQCTRELHRQKALSLLRVKKHSGGVASKRIRQVSEWRATNPTSHRESPSFAEILEDVFDRNRVAPSGKQNTFSDLIDTVLGAWGRGRAPLSREGLCQWIKTIHPEGRTLSNEVMYSWKNHPEHGPNQASVQTLVEAFKLDKTHELMIWRIARGEPPLEREGLIDEAERTIRTPEERESRARLFSTLIESSGIPLVRFQELLGVCQISLWKRGQSIADPEVCARFVRLVNPPALYRAHERESVQSVNKRMEAFLGARPSTIFDAVFAAERAGTVNPSGTLLELLTGRRGIRPMKYAQGATLIGVTESTFRHMRASSDRRGASISEEQATKITDWAQRVTPETRSLLSVVERAERRVAIDHLTGIPSPIALLVKLRQGELAHAGEVVRLTRVRRGAYQWQGLSDFELGKAHVSIPVAQKLADWLGFVGPDHFEARRTFICFATGVDQSQTADQIFDQVLKGEIPRYIALRRLFDLTGKTRDQISKTLSFSKTSARIMGTESSDGRISPSRRAIAVAREVGLLHRSDQFVEVFTPRGWDP